MTKCLLQDEEEEAPDEEEVLFNLDSNKSAKAIILEPLVEGKHLQMELDTGASVSVIPQKFWEEKFSEVKLETSTMVLKTYTGEALQVLGEAAVKVQYGKQEAKLPVVVVSGNGPALLGRNWLHAIKLNWRYTKHVCCGVEDLLKKHASLFNEGLGTLKGINARLIIKTDTIPKFLKPRSVPYALRDVIEKELERLEKLGVIEKVNHSEWATPIVPVPKPDGSTRICGDYKVTINPQMSVDQYPLPKVDDLLAELAGGKEFIKLDLTHAYQQVLLELESQKYLTINTHRGLYQYKRMPFGIASAPAVFQQIMEKVLQGIPKVVCYLEDVLVTGCNREEHLQNLKQVLERLEEHGLRLKKSKCTFMQKSVEYLGFLIDAEGIHASPFKIDAILRAQQPKDVKQLRSFLGLVNYYGRFIPDLASCQGSLSP